MARPAPKDLDYAPTLALTLTGASADTDLTAQFTEAPYAASEVVVTNTDAAAGALVVRLQGAPSTNVSILIAAGTTVTIRGAFVAFMTSTPDTVSATFFWQGGPS